MDYVLSLIWKDSISFYPDGRIESGYLAENPSVNLRGRQVMFKSRIPYSQNGAEREILLFHETGAVKRGLLYGNQQLATREGVFLFKGLDDRHGNIEVAVVSFDNAGYAVKGMLVKKYIKKGQYYYDPYQNDPYQNDPYQNDRAFLNDGIYYEPYQYKRGK